MTSQTVAAGEAVRDRKLRRVVMAAGIGNVFEGYDFIVYGSLASVIAKHFFSNVNPTAGFIFTLLAFAAGFFVRPFGALVFGGIGDKVGRKRAFLITITIMGAATFAIGGGTVPNWQAVRDLALEGARLFPECALLGWDIAPVEGGATIVEVNITPDLLLPQLADRRGMLDDTFKSFLQERDRLRKARIREVRKGELEEYRPSYMN